MAYMINLGLGSQGAQLFNFLKNNILKSFFALGSDLYGLLSFVIALTTSLNLFVGAFLFVFFRDIFTKIQQ